MDYSIDTCLSKETMFFQYILDKHNVKDFRYVNPYSDSKNFS